MGKGSRGTQKPLGGKLLETAYLPSAKISPQRLFAITEEKGFPGGSVVKNPPANVGNAEDVDSILRSGRSPGGGNGNPLQYSCLENPMDRGIYPWIGYSMDGGVMGYSPWGHKELDKTEYACTHRGKTYFGNDVT